MCYFCHTLGNNLQAPPHRGENCRDQRNKYSRWCKYCNKVTNRHNTATHRHPSSSTASSGGGDYVPKERQGNAGGHTPQDVSERNKRVIQETLQIVSLGHYTTGQGRKVQIQLGERPVICVNLRPLQGSHATRISVVNGDCLVVAGKYARRGLRVCLLDCASEGHFGGGYKGGARAQEEDLCRRSTLADQADPTLNGRVSVYPLHDNCAFVGGVTVFRDPAPGYVLLEEPFLVDILITAALNKPRLHNGHLLAEDIATTKLRIFNLIATAAQAGAEILVLGALGCGAFGNPPEDIALLFQEALALFPGVFKEVVFAILDDHNTGKSHNPNGNFGVFYRVLHDKNFDKSGAVAESGGKKVEISLSLKSSPHSQEDSNFVMDQEQRSRSASMRASLAQAVTPRHPTHRFTVAQVCDVNHRYGRLMELDSNASIPDGVLHELETRFPKKAVIDVTPSVLDSKAATPALHVSAAAGGGVAAVQAPAPATATLALSANSSLNAQGNIASNGGAVPTATLFRFSNSLADLNGKFPESSARSAFSAMSATAGGGVAAVQAPAPATDALALSENPSPNALGIISSSGGVTAVQASASEPVSFRIKFPGLTAIKEGFSSIFSPDQLPASSHAPQTQSIDDVQELCSTFKKSMDIEKQANDKRVANLVAQLQASEDAFAAQAALVTQLQARQADLTSQLQAREDALAAQLQASEATLVTQLQARQADLTSQLQAREDALAAQLQASEATLVAQFQAHEATLAAQLDTCQKELTVAKKDATEELDAAKSIYEETLGKVSIIAQEALSGLQNLEEENNVLKSSLEQMNQVYSQFLSDTKQVATWEQWLASKTQATFNS
jgi:uncharacterized protein (TIGR02452 family)